MLKSKQNKIDSAKWYYLSEMVANQFFPWCKNIATYRRYVLADRQASNYLKAVIMGHGRGKIYRIKGEHIINYLVNVEDGTYHI